MNYLPAEVLSEVFIHLCPVDKVECLAVCQHWNRVITSSILYHTLWISNRRGINTLLRMIQEKPDIANQVEKIMLDFSRVRIDPFPITLLLQTLPRIRTVIFINEEFRHFSVENGTPFVFHNQIEHILDESYFPHTYHLLSSYVCPRLTTLTIDVFGHNIIPHLKNAPALRDLTLRNKYIRIDDIEMIHTSLPQLDRLKLYHGSFNNTTHDINIIPTTSLSALVLDDVTIDTLETRIDLLVYVSKKYPDLTEFLFKNDNTRLNTSGIENLFKYAWTPFFKKLGPQLNKLCLDNRGQMNNPFETLDGFGCKIEHLELAYLTYSALAKIAESYQVHYIQKLTLKDTAILSFHWLNSLSVLKHLKITRSSYNITPSVHINLGDVLENAPSTLESLCCRRVTLVLPPDYTGFSGIKSLNFCNVDLPKGVDVFLSQYFPKLSKLSLKRCGVPEKMLRLPTANLTTFVYFAQSSNKKENVLVVTAGNNERRMYTAHTDMQRLSVIPYRTFYDEIYPSPKYRLADKSDTKPWFTLYCNSLYNISFIE